MRHLYTILLYLSVPLILARLYWRGHKAPDYRCRWGERFGLFPPLPEPGCIWIHAVSLGETRAALPLIRILRSRHPHIPVLVTTTTPTGSRQVREALGDAVYHVYVPYDLPGAVGRFLKRTRPRLAVIMETELWPNLFQRCRKAGIPLIVANARLSERSLGGYRKLRRLTAQTLDQVTLIAAQSRSDAGRFEVLGASSGRVRVIGNIKYDLDLPQGLIERGRELRRIWGAERPVLIAASTHNGEDEQILEAFARLRQSLPDLLLLLVPRHPERFAAVAGLCRQSGWRVAARSEHRSRQADIDIFLGDTLGELLLFYAGADVAFVGGSLVPTGGHNVLEPALLGLPVLFGPHMFNFTEISRHLLEAEAAFQVNDARELADQAGCLFIDTALRKAAGERGRAVVDANRGALAALVEIIEAYLVSASPAGRQQP